MADRELDAGLVARAHHRLGLLARSRDRLLAEHVLARLRGGDHVLGMEVRRRRDQDKVDVIRGADLLSAGQSRAAVSGERCGVVELECRDSDDLHVIEPERAVGMYRAREPRAQDTDA